MKSFYSIPLSTKEMDAILLGFNFLSVYDDDINGSEDYTQHVLMDRIVDKLTLQEHSFSKDEALLMYLSAYYVIQVASLNLEASPRDIQTSNRVYRAARKLSSRLEALFPDELLE